ncbi:ketopantoate reductase [Scopulibacillus darangshiensis]|uniref:2-dehydropantoate 2-reductase n=1 Tax=Scopulibacillus darangshiensis TaxID=442528 RepID=A0A4R2P2W0_9BACL|nr:2-dehydropantoate 2-reductase [Scopulibacillus darangshiensis]TCP29079.1 ketopantoate reductase [Scopulibacillus darangshiensis]
MKVGIIGGGALGLLFSAYLNKSFETTLYTRRLDQKKLIKQEGIIVDTKDSMFNSFPYVKNTDDTWDDDCLIIAVKQPALKNMLKELNNKTAKEQAIIFIQNGMGHIEDLSGLHHHNLYLGVVEHGARKKSDARVSHNGPGRTRIASYKGDLSLLAPFFEVNTFPFLPEYDWRNMLTRKLIINAVINPLTGIYNVQNGELVRDPHYRLIMGQLFEETANILMLAAREKEKGWRELLEICKNTEENRSSMLQDLDAGRCTEIEAISGYVLREAARLKRRAPLTLFLYHSILAAENRFK